jgi:membrane protein implicated in regulation of membrane protease activity
MKTFLKYLLFQLPGWLIGFVVLFFLISEDIVPIWSAVVLVVWVIKDLAIFPWVRAGYENSPSTGVERLIGMTAVTQGTLAPTGYVRINGELWRAQVDPADGPIPENTRVRVEDAQGLTLVVRDENASSTA